MDPQRPVDIIVPVYKGIELVRACISTILNSVQACSWNLLIIDDASPEPELRNYLDSLREIPRITVVQNPSNLGFVATVNCGMAMHPDRDVVLLNSDTEVNGNWLDRLRNCAYRQPRIGTATPFSNNATICSYPNFCEENALQKGLALAELDNIFAQVNSGRWIDIPTGVGFCMYIRRDCLNDVGLFNQDRFGRGYGEENDFCRRAVARGWQNVLCADTFVYHSGGASFGDERFRLQTEAHEKLLELHPDYDVIIQDFIIGDPAANLRRAASIELERRRRDRALPDPPENPYPSTSGTPQAKPVQLHIAHDLGGGAEQWLRDYCRADRKRINLVLRPYSRSHTVGEGVALYADAQDEIPMRLWLFKDPIQAVLPTHAEYRAALKQTLEEFAVAGILVSSLIGHSLDVLETGLSTLVICHDYFPYCPAINLHFQGKCEHCDPLRLIHCHHGNPDFNPFNHFPPAARLCVRSGFVDRMTSGSVSLVAPSQSVLDNLIRLEPRFGQSGGVVIPHGQGTEFPPSSNTFNPGMGRLKLLVLGMLASSKGLHLLTDTIDSITPFADVYLLGSGEMGALFEGRTGVHVLGPYRLEALPEIVTRIQPHIGLLMSVCEETFSYTLGELMRLGIPPVATRVGSFPERIRHGVTGFLYDPTPAALLVCLHDIDSHRSTLKTVHQRLLRRQSRSALEMVEDYHRLLPLTARSPSVGQPARRECEWLDDPALIVPYIELSNRWKESKRLHLSMTVKDMLLADAARQREALAASLREQTRLAESRLAQIEAIHASTSWRVTRPIRQARILARFLRHAFRQPTRLPGLARHLLNAGHAGGRPALKLALLHPPTPASQPVVSGMNLADPASADSPSLEFLDAAARSTLISRIETMRKTPRISVLIPTYNTPEAMLRATLDSVRNQLYPHWQLCVADDASTLPHVRTVLQDLAAADSRVRLDFAATNGGVACASNRALAMAEGEFTVLLDHDDLLEPQALFRVAEAIVEDAPDMLYSDEWLVDAEATHVVHTAYRPTFSPEYLRSHPYIVHLLGFRTGFLRELGGFDETLRISQDYDLVLRASEKARTIVHVPEPLYLWRTHPNSAGHAMQDHVMATSRAILERHLARCGEAGRVEDGAAFNFFDVRYPLQPGLKVAILIPTRNHADLVRACLDSLAWTLREVAHDIVLIDHDSDDPVARAYFDSLAGRVRLLRHSGPFNFSAINNRAVAQLDAGYSHYLFLNNDIEAIEPGWLERMLELGQKADVGAVGAKLFYPDGRTIQHAGVAVPCCGVAENLGRFHVTQDGCRDEGYNGSLNCNREVSAVTAACLLIQARVFHEIGGFDESLAVGFGDVDLCLRIGRRGYRNLFCAHAVLLHHESKTRGRMQEDPHPEDTERFMAKWADLYTASDPYFNPNLSGETPDWQAIMPPALNLDLSRRVYLSNKLA